MTTPINDGGPAFPVPYEFMGTGMSLRDYFAAKAMQGMLADPDVTPNMRTAQTAYEMADAMLRARSQGDDDAT